MDWSERFASADAVIDGELGDEVEFAADGATFTALACFVFPEGAEIDPDFGGVDPIRGKPRLKVSKVKIPTPNSAHRFKVPQLADPVTTRYRPENWVSVSSGRYWLIDLQKAST